MVHSNTKWLRPEFRVLFISQTAQVDAPYLDPSVRYRCYNPAEVMEKENVLCDVVAQTKLTDSLIPNYDAFVFHRPHANNMLLPHFIEEIRKAGKSCVADYDDLIFAPEYALHSSIFVNGHRSESQVRAIFMRNFDGLKLFSRFTVSTEPLKRHILSLLPDAEVLVVHNGLSEDFLAGLDLSAIPAEQKFASSLKLISYLSGTASHNQDFASVSSILQGILSENNGYRLGVYGPLKIPENFPARKLLRRPHLNYRDFFKQIGTAYVNIAPLAADNAFNECKSALKFFESAIWGVPTIASPLPDFLRFQDSPGLLLCKTEEDWQQAFMTLLDREKYLYAVHSLREYCQEHCLSSIPGKQLLNFLENHK